MLSMLPSSREVSVISVEVVSSTVYSVTLDIISFAKIAAMSAVLAAFCISTKINVDPNVFVFRGGFTVPELF